MFSRRAFEHKAVVRLGGCVGAWAWRREPDSPFSVISGRRLNNWRGAHDLRSFCLERLTGAPRSMKMGTTRSPWRYDAAIRHALQSANLRRPAILHYASSAAVSPISQ